MSNQVRVLVTCPYYSSVWVPKLFFSMLYSVLSRVSVAFADVYAYLKVTYVLLRIDNYLINQCMFSHLCHRSIPFVYIPVPDNPDVGRFYSINNSYHIYKAYYYPL